jgi:hypothetical protein
MEGRLKSPSAKTQAFMLPADNQLVNNSEMI